MLCSRSELGVLDGQFACYAHDLGALSAKLASLAEAARRGKQLFEGKAGCAGCHSGPYLTGGKMHNVGTGSGHWEEADGRYDTPSLRELCRTAPYLHDGRAWTLREVLTTFNRRQRHGHGERLSAAEFDDLIAHLLSL